MRSSISEAELAAVELLEAERAYRCAQSALLSGEPEAHRLYADCVKRLELAQHRVEVMLEHEAIEPHLAMC